MSDDHREREPLQDRADRPEEGGTRSDHAGTGTGPAGVSHGGTDAVRETELRTQDREGRPPTGQATGPGGGYGVASEAGSGGSGEGTRPSGADDQTDWLRDADGGPDSPGA